MHSDTIKFLASLLVPVMGLAAMFGALRSQISTLIKKADDIESKQDEQVKQNHEMNVRMTRIEGRLDLLEYRTDRHKTPLAMPAVMQPRK